jgi:hypothetical protein
MAREEKEEKREERRGIYLNRVDKRVVVVEKSEGDGTLAVFDLVIGAEEDGTKRVQ